MVNEVEVQPQIEPDWGDANLGFGQASQGLSGGEPSEQSTLNPISVAGRNRASLRLPHGRLINRQNPRTKASARTSTRLHLQPGIIFPLPHK
jgi:hypothetical protein